MSCASLALYVASLQIDREVRHQKMHRGLRPSWVSARATAVIAVTLLRLRLLHLRLQILDEGWSLLLMWRKTTRISSNLKPILTLVMILSMISTSINSRSVVFHVVRALPSPLISRGLKTLF